MARIDLQRILADDIRVFIGGAAIHNEVLDREGTALRDHALNGLLNIGALVERRRDNAEFRNVRHAPFTRRAEKPLIVSSSTGYRSIAARRCASGRSPSDSSTMSGVIHFTASGELSRACRNTDALIRLISSLSYIHRATSSRDIEAVDGHVERRLSAISCLVHRRWDHAGSRRSEERRVGKECR